MRLQIGMPPRRTCGVHVGHMTAARGVHAGHMRRTRGAHAAYTRDACGVHAAYMRRTCEAMALSRKLLKSLKVPPEM